jgi:hypothetical protein
MLHQKEVFMGRRLLPVVIAAVVLLLPTSALAGGEINLFYGQKDLEDDWDPLESQQTIGLQLTFGHQWPVAVAIDYLKSSDDGSYNYYGYSYKIEAETTEFDVGVRYLFRKDKTVVPYVGGGLAYIDGVLSVEGFDFSDSAVGFWIAGGVNFRIGKFFNLGVDLRSSSAEIKPSELPIEIDAGGVSYGVLLGFRWGGS